MSRIEILYQDQWLVAANKPAGFLTHPADHPKPDDQVLMKQVRDQIGIQIHTLHRLDQPTSGLVLFAKDSNTAKKLRKAFEKREIQKKYLAVVHGHPTLNDWECHIPLQKTPEAPSKNAHTKFSRLKTLPNQLSLIQAIPITGRFHQIRKHLLTTGYPIVGDFRYLEEDDCHRIGKRLGIGTRMLLQASELALTLTHPVTQKDLKITTPIDPEIQKVISLI